MNITTAMIEEGLKQLSLDSEMLGKVGTGETEIKAAIQESRKARTKLMVSFLMGGISGERVSKRLLTKLPADPIDALLEEAWIFDLPITFFRLGYLLAQQQEAAAQVNPVTPQEAL